MSDYLAPIFIFVLVESLGYDLLSFFGESHDFLTDWTGPTRVLLVQIVKHSHPCSTVTIVSNSFGKYWNKCWLSSIYITYDSYFDEFLSPLSSFHLSLDQINI